MCNDEYDQHHQLHEIDFRQKGMAYDERQRLDQAGHLEEEEGNV